MLSGHRIRLTPDFNLTIEQVASSPIYTLPTPLVTFACVVCPGKTFKSEHVRDTHVTSRIHARGMARWLARLKEAEEGGKALESEDPRIVAAEITDQLNLRKEVSCLRCLYRTRSLPTLALLD